MCEKIKVPSKKYMHAHAHAQNKQFSISILCSCVGLEFDLLEYSQRWMACSAFCWQREVVGQGT